ncbi:MAG: SDR family NAD(P)-dependent oxidoreductase, partial [Planctomycetaceae bacterium]|nr:SDR family NAD(P)-dependent oxidoreductase [Planctomycetaceae bacterium]
MGQRLKDRVALVTGAGSSGPGWGNGKATAVLFAREGARVCLVDINREAVEETAGIIREEGGECLVEQVDVTDSEQVQRVVNLCTDTWGQLDVLHNNVGILEMGGPVEASLESWERVVAVNLTSMFLTCKHALPVMERQARGAIVNIASITAIRYIGLPYVSYSATKGGVLQLTQSIALQYAAKGIRANSILPGLMNTPMIVEPLKDAYADGDVDEMIRMRNEQ